MSDELLCKMDRALGGDRHDEHGSLRAPGGR